jgi:hypothetical protein
MTEVLAEKRSTSIFGKLLGPERPLWATVTITLVLLLLPLIAAFLDDVLSDFFVKGYWQGIYLPSAVILYIMFVGPVLTRLEMRVTVAFRPLVQIDDTAFERLVIRASRTNPIADWIAFGVGLAFGLSVGLAGIEASSAIWLELWVLLSGTIMFGLLGWTVYAAVASTRLTSELHRHPLCIDIFDTKPFEPIGRQSLALSLVFVGGILLSMVFHLGNLNIFAWQNWVVYLTLVIVIVLVFFLNMRGTHRVLAAAKRKEEKAVEEQIIQSSRTLMDCISAGDGTGSLGAEISALVIYQERVRAARTWPYDTAQLRTLFFSLIIPVAVEAVKLVSNAMFK